MTNQLPSPTPPMAGSATLQGTEQYAARFPELDPTHFRLCHALISSSIGIGTYLGEASDEVDQRYEDCIYAAITHGCNVIDTAINYRFQRSERVVGRALRRAIADGFARDEFIVCTKGGFIPFDCSLPNDPYQWIEDNLFAKGIITPDDIHPSGHCMAPMFLYNQLEQSLQNLGLEKIDVYYLHNPETQMSELNEPRFYEAVEMAFYALENAVRDGKISYYGLATWDGFLENSESGRLIQLEMIMELAQRAGGAQHHCRFIELPVNLSMTDAMSAPNQKVGERMMTFLEAARALNVCVVASASLFQGGLARSLPVTLQQAIPGMRNDAARALQFARSIPGIVTALVGMSSRAHVGENLELASIAAMSEAEFNLMFGDR